MSHCSSLAFSSVLASALPGYSGLEGATLPLVPPKKSCFVWSFWDLTECTLHRVCVVSILLHSQSWSSEILKWHLEQLCKEDQVPWPGRALDAIKLYIFMLLGGFCLILYFDYQSGKYSKADLAVSIGHCWGGIQKEGFKCSLHLPVWWTGSNLSVFFLADSNSFTMAM